MTCCQPFFRRQGRLRADAGGAGKMLAEPGRRRRRTRGGRGRRAVLWLPAVGLLLALLTGGGLHLDGLADTADGPGSRRPAEQALDIMRRPDAGPMGVAALVLTLLIQVAALAARPGGFGALVAGRTAAPDRELTVTLLGCAVAVAGLLAGALIRLAAMRRLGGMTGDVFGAIVEVSTAAALVACAVAS